MLLQPCSLLTLKSLNVYTGWLSSLDTNLVSWQQHLLIQISLLLTLHNGMLCDHMQVLLLPGHLVLSKSVHGFSALYTTPDMIK